MTPSDELLDLGGFVAYETLEEAVLGLLEDVPAIRRWIEEYADLPLNELLNLSDYGFGDWILRNLGLGLVPEKSPLVRWFRQKCYFCHWFAGRHLQIIVLTCLISEVRDLDWSHWK